MALDPELIEKALREATKRAENLDYFFDHLKSPEWIEPLSARGFFSEPPQQLVEDGYVKAPAWSASRYLARVARDAPEMVADVIRSIDSNNERVHQDFEQAALAMPAGEASEIAALEVEWIGTRDHLYYGLASTTVLLIERLAHLGKVGSSLALLRVLFEPLPDRREGEWVLRHPQSRFSDWEYDRLLGDVSSRLTSYVPRDLVVVLGDLLDRAIVHLADDDDGTPPPDRLWRTRIASDQHRAVNVEDALVSALRDTIGRIRDERLVSDEDLTELLAPRGGLFQRLLMHGLAAGPLPAHEQVRAYVMNLEEFKDGEPSVEYRELLEREAPRLSATDMSELLAIVEKGPDVDLYRERVEKYGEAAPTDAEVAGYVARWQIGRLALLSEALPPEWNAKRSALIEEHGSYEIGVNFEARTFVGPTSPISEESFHNMRDDELVEYLETWVPGGQWDSPSIEGLARAFSGFAERNPARASALINRLRDARPAYVQWALHGLEQSIGRGEAIAWSEVLDLMDWIVVQPRERVGGREDDYGHLDPGWVWTRRAMASLVQRGLSVEGESRIRFFERERVWRIISAVAADPDPTPEDEERFGKGNMDPATLALNATRPRAIHAAIAYAIWVFHEIYPRAEERDSYRGAFFAQIPEVADLLRAHLDPDLDPSEAVRGAIGQRYSNLFALDRGWATDSAHLLFPGEDSALREAGWGSYVIYNGPYNDVLEAIRDKYLRSAELVGVEGHGFRWMNADPRARLGEHIVTFYWRGIIDLSDALLTTYWTGAPPEIKEEVLAFLGRSTRELPTLEAEVIERLKAFWEVVRQTEAPDAPLLGAFAWWFASSSLPAEWRLAELGALLTAAVRSKPDFLVVEALSELADEQPLQVAQLTRRFLEIELPHQPWIVDASREQIEKVVLAAIESGDLEARRTAEEVVNWLGARGYREFRRLVV